MWLEYWGQGCWRQVAGALWATGMDTQQGHWGQVAGALWVSGRGLVGK